MNKLIIGLLIIAAGTGVFFLLRKTKGTQTENRINKEWLLGKWKEAGKDSAGNYLFEKNGVIIHAMNDSLNTDSSYYSWKDNDLVWKEDQTDSIGKIFIVRMLTQDSLQLQGTDSANILLVKTK
jgi:hypothetical protein